MIRGIAGLAILLSLTSCRSYDYYPRVSDAGGLVTADQLARYGKEQSQAAAISHRFAELHRTESPQAQADSVVAFARTQPDVVAAASDPQTHRVTVDFKSGWRVGLLPLSK